MDRNTRVEVEPKFTRGEKCIFLHLVLTFVLIIILVLIFAIHLYLVNHNRNGIFNTRRNLLELRDANGSENLLVGYIFLNLTTTVKFICNSLLLRPRWSLCTAHCVSMRNDPALRHSSLAWGLRYKINTKVRSNLQSSIFVTGIKNAIVHPHFNRDSFENNIGLIEHTKTAPLLVHTVLNPGAVIVSPLNRNNMVIVDWNHIDNKSSGDIDINSISYDLVQMTNPKCKESLAPITTIRNNEFCVFFKKRHRHILGYGSVVIANSKLMGLFSWGERLQKVLPLVILNVTLFQDWIASTII